MHFWLLRHGFFQPAFVRASGAMPEVELKRNVKVKLILN
jgi:hypothetical protein